MKLSTKGRYGMVALVDLALRTAGADGLRVWSFFILNGLRIGWRHWLPGVWIWLLILKQMLKGCCCATAGLA